jgi:hypothetical protein
MPPGTPWFFNVLAGAGIAKGTKLTHTVGTVANLVGGGQPNVWRRPARTRSGEDVGRPRLDVGEGLQPQRRRTGH